MRHKSILIAIIVTSSSLVGCLGESSEGVDEISEEEKNRLNLEITELEGQIVELEGHILSLNANISQLELDYDAAISTRSALQEDVSNLIASLEIANQNIASLESEKKDIANESGVSLAQLNSSIAENMSIVASLESQLATAISDLALANGEISILELSWAEANVTISTLLEGWSGANSTIANFEAGWYNSNTTISELMDQNAELNAASLVCGNTAIAMNGECVSDHVAWGNIPFEMGTNVSLTQAFRGAFTHYGNGIYAVDFSGVYGDVEEGTPVVAYKSGIVKKIKEDSDVNCIDEGIDIEDCTHSNHVIIDHGDFTFATYGHLQQNSVDVEVGDSVGSGHQIGRIGNTGYSTGPHLHLEVSNGWFRPVMPLFEELRGISNGVPFSGLSVISNNSNQSLNEVFSYSHCPLDTFNFRGVELTSEIPCSVAALDVNYSLTGMVLIEGNQLHVGQYEGGSDGWNYYCVETNSTGHFSTTLNWPSDVNNHNNSSYLMLSVAREGCYTFSSWSSSVQINFD